MELQYAQKQADFYNDLEDPSRRDQTIGSIHCGLGNPNLVQVPKVFGEKGELLWRHGSFNVRIPVCINRTTTRLNNSGSSLPSKLGLRIPLPYRIGEEAFPGNSEEKVRSEPATYTWVNKHCPDISVPRLRGFELTGGLSFCEPRSLSFWQRAKLRIWRFIHDLYRSGESITSDYVPQQRAALLDRNYILVDWIKDTNAQILSTVFLKPHTDLQSENPYRSISKIMISLASIPQPRIGSWTINDSRQISLTNRPIFYLDLLAGHDNRLIYQKNAIYSEDDARTQAKDVLLMR
ncbi:hypothetical protein AJ79_01978 [Helicocarpus griseus UAMH5409]|uniref:Uncharacterized protein n=1 Tax=Helicocarpus griseus UAMH5409 TaxID=1447875 RepID=A0A2B7Y508_9EURO|nr:hypothetical protein AJ79_01978 [Helicocarpus griseus UAMH5409]